MNTVLAIVILVILLVILMAAWILHSYCPEFLSEYPPDHRWVYPLYPMGLWIYDRLHLETWSSKKGKEEEHWNRGIYIGKPSQWIKRKNTAEQICNICYVIMSGLGIMLIVLLLSGGEAENPYENYTIDRPEFGETETHQLTVDGIGETERTITVAIDGKQPQEDAMMEIFDKAFEVVKKTAAGENPSLDEMRNDFNFCTATEYGIRVTWFSRSPEWVDDRGHFVETEAEIPEEGTIVSFLVTLTYSSYEKSYELYARILPPQKNEAFYLSMLNQILNDENKTASTQIKLPRTLEQLKLSYKVKQTNPIWLILLIILAASFLVPQKAHSGMKKQYQNRREQLKSDYGEFVSKLNFGLQTGMNLRSAWKRMTDDYKNSLDKKEGKIRYVYEEMIVTVNEMTSGSGEGKAYAMFGMRCEDPHYVRLGNYLQQNLRQGVSGLCDTLEMELFQFLEEEKNETQRIGEKLGTKMLIPMFMMLGVVMTVLMFPAFLTMHI